MFFTLHAGVICHLGKRHSSFFSVKNVLNEENLRRTAAKFANMKPIRLQTHQPYKKAAVLIPLCVVDEKVSILYTLRAPELKSHRGQVSFPGGMLDDKDKSLEHTAIRETKEELGLEEKRIRILGGGQLIVTRREMSVLPVIGLVKNELNVNSLKINRSEVEEVFAVSLEDLCDPKMIAYTQFREGYSTPVFLGGPRRIWGLTALITNAFLRSLLSPNVYRHRIKNIPPVTITGNRYFADL